MGKNKFMDGDFVICNGVAMVINNQYLPKPGEGEVWCDSVDAKSGDSKRAIYPISSLKPYIPGTH